MLGRAQCNRGPLNRQRLSPTLYATLSLRFNQPVSPVSDQHHHHHRLSWIRISIKSRQ